MGFLGTHCEFVRALFQVRDVILMIMVRFVQTLLSFLKDGNLIHGEMNVTKKKRGGKTVQLVVNGCKNGHYKEGIQLFPNKAKDGKRHRI